MTDSRDRDRARNNRPVDLSMTGNRDFSTNDVAPSTLREVDFKSEPEYEIMVAAYNSMKRKQLQHGYDALAEVYASSNNNRIRREFLPIVEARSIDELEPVREIIENYISRVGYGVSDNEVSLLDLMDDPAVTSSLKSSMSSEEIEAARERIEHNIEEGLEDNRTEISRAIERVEKRRSVALDQAVVLDQEENTMTRNKNANSRNLQMNENKTTVNREQRRQNAKQKPQAKQPAKQTREQLLQARQVAMQNNLESVEVVLNELLTSYTDLQLLVVDGMKLAREDETVAYLLEVHEVLASLREGMAGGVRVLFGEEPEDYDETLDMVDDGDDVHDEE